MRWCRHSFVLYYILLDWLKDHSGCLNEQLDIGEFDLVVAVQIVDQLEELRAIG